MKVGVREAALKLLSVRPRSVVELRQRLLQKKYSPEEVESCTVFLQEKGFLDDQAFAEGWVGGRGPRKLIGRGRLANELRVKGVSREVIQGAVGAVDEEQERERALTAARQKWKSLSNLPADVARRRLYGILSRRGFNSTVIRFAITQVTQGEMDENERD